MVLDRRPLSSNQIKDRLFPASRRREGEMLRTLHQQPWAVSSPVVLPNSNANSHNRVYRLLLRPSFFISTEAMGALSIASSASSSSSSSMASPFGCSRPLTVRSSLTDFPALWAVRTCVFYALLQAGIAGQPSSSNLPDDSEGLQAPKWLKNVFGGKEEAQHSKDLRRGRNKWQKTTKGTLKRRYRVPTKSEGRRLLNLISSLLSDDDTFRDATSHKGCQIRRENAHAETVCCNNVRATFDELPTLHLVIEITAFPAGPITTGDYEKADKMEKLLRTGNSI